MKASLKVKLGDKVLEIQGEGAEGIIVKALSFWSSLPSECGNCKSKSISLSHRATSKGAYYGLRCLSCTADLTFHQRKPESGGGFYLTQDDKWEVYAPGSKIESTSKNGGTTQVHDDEDVPF